MIPAEVAAATPLERGYWTDEEMFEATGADSIAVVKLMQRRGLLLPEKRKTPNGKQARIWNIAEMLRIAATLDIPRQTGFSLAASVEIFGLIGRSRLDLGTCGAAITMEIANALSKTTRSRSTETWDVETDRLTRVRKDTVRLAILNRSAVYLLTAADTDQPSATPLGQLINMNGHSPEVSVRCDDTDFGNAKRTAESILEVRLSRLGSKLIGHLTLCLWEATKSRRLQKDR